MRIIIVYYSRTQNTRCIAKQIQEILENENNVELLQISEKRKLNFLKILFTIKKGDFYSMVLGSPRLVYNTVFWKTPKIEDINIDLKEYDLLIIGSPIWYGRLPPAVNTFISMLKKTNLKKKVIIFVTSGFGKNYENYVDVLKNKFNDSGMDVIGKIHIDPENVAYLSKENKETILNYVRSLKKTSLSK